MKRYEIKYAAIAVEPEQSELDKFEPLHTMVGQWVFKNVKTTEDAGMFLDVMFNLVAAVAVTCNHPCGALKARLDTQYKLVRDNRTDKS